jgi:uncharacterized protein YgbK (DUF1537 family)
MPISWCRPFSKGGRFTRDSIHYLNVNGVPTPVHETEFARDSVFGYRHSYLPDYVEEKTGGRIKAGQVERFTLEDVRGDVSARLMALAGNRCCVVDAETQADLDHFADQLRTAAARRASASCSVPPPACSPPWPGCRPAGGGRGHGGLCARPAARRGHRRLHVKKTTAQLEQLLKEPGVASLEVDVDRIPTHRENLLRTSWPGPPPPMPGA